ncbi:MAG: M23 family metallopeptidase [Candidatus Obscuribacterales bacterium]|nr:M23 family metallopeptidase [Cyanobacteria bacterium HKST-UBA01]MCB9471832.1 M23 family metallopeptidase [Candidatus Obscuribacterales bacterium]
MKRDLSKFIQLGILLSTVAFIFESCESQTSLEKLAEDSKDEAVVFVVERSSNEARLYAFSTRLLEATVDVSVSGYNLICSPSSKVVRGLSSGLSDPIVSIRSLANTQDFKFDYSRSWHVGSRSRKLSSKTKPHVLDRLPFDSHQEYKVSQGAFGPTHLRNSSTENSVDFDMPIGSLVCAAQSGVVIGFREDSAVGGVDDRFDSCANYIAVKHDDGTYAAYYHLKRHGVLVPIGRRVSDGDAIALSGNTGNAGGPHLHFEVFQYDSSGKSHSLPIQFKTSIGIVTPKTGMVMHN